jgi:hypothetical protein
VVKQSTTDSVIEDLNLVVIQPRRKWEKRIRFMTAISITVVDHMTKDPEIEGLNLAAAWHKKISLLA